MFAKITSIDIYIVTLTQFDVDNAGYAQSNVGLHVAGVYLNDLWREMVVSNNSTERSKRALIAKLTRDLMKRYDNATLIIHQ